MPEDEAVGEDIAPIIAPRAHVIDVEPGVDVELRDDGLVFPAPLRPDVASRPNGDVIVSGRGAGFLRRIVGRHDEGDRVVVETAPADLSEVFEQMRLRGSLTNNEAVGLTPKTTLTPTSKRLSLPAIDVRDVHMPLTGGSSIDIVEGLFELSPDVDVDLLLRRRAIDRFTLAFTADARGVLKLRYHLAKTDSNLTIQSPRLADRRIASLPPKYVVFWIGFVPVVVAIRLSLEAGAQFDVTGDVSGEASLEANGSMQTTLKYDDGSFQDRSGSSLTVKLGGGENQINSWMGSGEVRLTAKVSLEFYELAGPYVGLQAFAGLHGGNEGSGPEVYGDLGLRGIVGAKAGVFGRSIKYEKQLFEKSIRTPK
ncbi:MAG TPA: hypothetical protein VM925_04455 [Labilithrix sp.]|nr:hypothetical protein [Labilithrix sp.]